MMMMMMMMMMMTRLLTFRSRVGHGLPCVYILELTGKTTTRPSLLNRATTGSSYR
jgi:hypothetical protein